MEKPILRTTVQRKEKPRVNFDPNTIAVQYYFGDLQYWRLPSICVEAIEHGFDGPTLRRLAGLANPAKRDIQQESIDAAFCEMGVNAPISKEKAQLALATDAAKRALAGETNVFDEATHIRIHICELHDPPPELQPIVNLSKACKHPPRSQWDQLEKQLRDAMTALLQIRA